MRQELEGSGYNVNVVAINIVRAETSQSSLSSRCSFDLLQDVASVNVWSLMGGGKDDFFIYRQEATLAPSGYLPLGGPVYTNLSSTEGYANVYNAIVAAHDMGPGKTCTGTSGGWQLPGDINQDARVNISDAVSLLLGIFQQSPNFLPCEGESVDSAGNLSVFDLNRDTLANLSDAAYLVNYLFNRGLPPVAGTECIQVSGCSDVCGQ